MVISWSNISSVDHRTESEAQESSWEHFSWPFKNHSESWRAIFFGIMLLLTPMTMPKYGGYCEHATVLYPMPLSNPKILKLISRSGFLDKNCDFSRRLQKNGIMVTVHQ